MQDDYADYNDKWDNPESIDRMDPWEDEDPFA